MNHFYDKEDILTYKTDEIPLGSTVIIKTKWDVYKGKLIQNNEDCIAIDYPKELKGTYLARDGIESIRVLGSFLDLMNLIIKKDGVNMNREQLLNEIEEFKRQQKELTEKLEWLQTQIDEDNNKKEWWIPKEGEGYCYIGSDGYVERVLNRDKNIDKCKINNLNYFQTEQQAERQAFEELLHRKLKKFALENNEKEIDWSDGYFKYSIYYNYKDKKIEEGYLSRGNGFGLIYFNSKNIVEKAIEEFKDDLIRYFTSDK